MKTSILSLFALTISAALAIPVQAQSHGHGGGGGIGFSGGGHIPSPAHAAAPSFHSMPHSNFGGGRMPQSGQRFSPVGRYSPSSAAFRQHYINSNRGASIGGPRFNRGNINRGDRLTRFPNGGNRAIANPRSEGKGTGQVRSGNSLPANWRSHVVAQHSTNWHRAWDRSRDHSWHGHHCRFINGSWVIFDLGFYPGSYWYPDDYYAPDYYADSYGYDPGYDESGVYQAEEYYDRNGSADQYNDSTVAVAQERLARQGYYRGEIDGVFGPQTRNAIMRFQGDHGMRVTGSLTNDTLDALGLPRIASN